MSDKWISIGALIVSGLSFLYNIYNNYQNNKLKKEIQSKDNRLEINFMFEKIRNKKEVLEDKLVELISTNKSLPLEDKQKIFLQTYNKYTSLYNEIEDFCTKLYDGVIESENYIKETLLPTLNQLAEMQVDTYKSLVDYSSDNNLKSINKPDYKAFDKYDKFLIEYNGGETSYFWKKIKNARRDSGFE